MKYKVLVVNVTVLPSGDAMINEKIGRNAMVGERIPVAEWLNKKSEEGLEFIGFGGVSATVAPDQIAIFKI